MMNYKQKIGQYGEDLAVEYLKRKKYQIISRNTKTSYQEIDIIAKVKEKTIIVEVKTRISGAPGLAEENFSRRKINNLMRALKLYAVKSDIDPDEIQLDLITIDINRVNKRANIKHYKDVF
ncbi:MAG: YraN family protein [Candidatus Falkowbacteria bacterium]